MPQSRIQMIKELARKIKYRELTGGFGETVIINGLDFIETDLVRQLRSFLPGEATMQSKEQKYFELAIAKYGILDVDFIVSDALLEDNYRSGINLLRDINFFPNMPSPEDTENYNDAAEFSAIILQDMIDELSLNQVYMRLFLQMPVKQRPTMRLESDFFPATFVVQDACLTNVPSIWFNKHFYL